MIAPLRLLHQNLTLRTPLITPLHRQLEQILLPRILLTSCVPVKDSFTPQTNALLTLPAFRVPETAPVLVEFSWTDPAAITGFREAVDGALFGDLPQLAIVGFLLGGGEDSRD